MPMCAKYRRMHKVLRQLKKRPGWVVRDIECKTTTAGNVPDCAEGARLRR